MILANIHFLEQGIDLLVDINDSLYTGIERRFYKSSAGKHMRHILEHYSSLVDAVGGNVDYDARERNERIETDLQYAIQTGRSIIKKLQRFSEDMAFLETEVKVRSNEGAQSEDSPWSRSTVKRELQFLLSHTVHHYALVAVILRIQGYTPHEAFGVAPSTLRYLKESLPDTAG